MKPCAVKGHLAVKVAIDSDFIDFYDYAFDSKHCADIVWERKTRTTMSKREQLKILEEHGLRVPTHGTVLEVCELLEKEYDLGAELFNSASEKLITVVVYLDEYAHQGKGKVCVPLKTALEKYPRKYCSEFIQTTPSPDAVSYRYLEIGRRAFWLRYTGYDSWMSNHAHKVDVHYLCPSKQSLGLDLAYPMYAIDFIPGRVFYAVDLNTAPGLQGTGIPLSANDVYELVKEWFCAYTKQAVGEGYA